VCKVLEMFLRDSIVEHLTKYQLIEGTQHGFTKGRSCLTNLLTFFEDVTDYVDKGNAVDVIYLDFQKAFDKVPHKRLLRKVRSLGIGGHIYNWLENWLSQQSQRVQLAGFSSDWVEVKSGVPQGSVLGPILFLIYINDIDEGISSKILKFADDTKLYRKLETDSDIVQLQQDLANLFEWSRDWLMLFNVEKCKVMHIGYNNVETIYTMNGSALQKVAEEQDLGVVVQGNLKCTKQCAKVVTKANRTLAMIKRNFSNFSAEVVLRLYKSLVRPQLEYVVQAWRPHLKKDIMLIEGVQRRATKLVHHLKDSPYETRLRSLRLTTLETRRLRGDLIEVFNI